MRPSQWRYTIPLRLRSLLQRENVDRELDEELQFHLDRHIEEQIALGLTPEEARRSARLAVGGLSQRKEECRDMRRVNLLIWMAEETAASIRRIRRHAGNFVHLVLVLALGIGCVIGIFDVAYGALHRAMPSSHPDRVAVAGGQTMSLLYAYDRPNPHLDTVFERSAEYRLFDANLDSGQKARRIQVAMVSTQFFSTLGIPISTGHDFFAGDYHPEPSSQPRDALPVILSQELWRVQFGSNEAILDKPIELNISPYRFYVIGVAPPEVGFPVGVDAWVPVHLFSFSIIQTATVPGGSGGVIGLLKPGLSMAAVEAAMRTWPKERLFDGGDGTVKLTSLRDFLAGELYPLSLKLWLASLFFLVLIVIAAATVVQTEAEVRRHEFEIRSALGASAGRLFASLNLETGLIVSFALAASFLVRSTLIRVTSSYLSLPKGFYLGVRGIDLAMAAGVAGIAWAACILVQRTNLRQGGLVRKRSDISRYRLPGQIIPATIILIAAALLARSAYKTMHIDTGVQTGGVFVSEVSFPFDWERLLRTDPKMSQTEIDKAFADASRLFNAQMNSDFSAILNTLAKGPGVIHAGVLSTAPYKGNGPFGLEAQVYPTADVPPEVPKIHWLSERSMTPEAVPALGMRLLYGRNFTSRGAEDENTVIVNQALAAKLGPGPAALGQYVKRLPTSEPARIVGIVSNVHEQDLFSEVRPTAYRPFSQWGLSDVDLVVRTSGGVSSADALHLIEASVRSTAPSAVVSHFERLSTMVESAGTLARYTAYYLLALALLSVFLAGFCASSKTLGEFHRRKQEIGIRMALGATKGDVIGLLVFSDLVRSAIAALFGAALAWWFSRLLSHLLYDVKLTDPISYFVGVTTLIGSVAMVQVLLLKKILQQSPRDLI